MKGLEVDPSIPRLRVVNGSRVVATTDGTLINLIPTLRSFSGLTVEYPDPPQGSIRFWSGFQQVVIPSTGGDQYTQRQSIQHVFCRNSQELETGQNLMTAPVGADFFAGWLRLNRTVAPTHPWWASNLNTLPPTGAWIPWNGSGTIEWTRGITRLLHLVIEGGQLRLIMQQSVGPKIGGAGGTFGIYPPSSLFLRRVNGSGGLFYEVDNSGVAVWTSTASPWRREIQTSFEGETFGYDPPDYVSWHPTLGTYPVQADPTNYRSVYTVDVKGYFGRRS